jgi:hypothetical protein
MARTILVNHARPKMENGRKPWAPPALDSAYLENKFQTELNVAPFGSGLGQRHRDRIGSETYGAGSGIDIGRLEIGVVEDVEELCPELQAKPFGYQSVLENGKVKVDQSRPEQRVSSIVADDGSVSGHG